jgi:tryptophan 2,3-dioxygenase
MIDELALAWLRVAVEEIRFAHQDVRAGRISEAWQRLELVVAILSPYVESEAAFYAWRKEVAQCR